MTKEVSSNWEETVSMLTRTLVSVLNQNSEAFEIVVVCNEKPKIVINSPRVNWVEVDYDVQLTRENSEQSRRHNILVKHTDKGRKLLKGLIVSQEFNPTHVMFLDADDLISNKLAVQCEKFPTSNGWIINKGYRYKLGSKWIYKKRKDFNIECGSAYIIKNELIPRPKEPKYDKGFDYYRFYINHAYISDKLKKSNHPLSKLEFPGAVYVIHGSNFYATERFTRENTHLGILRFLKNVINTKILTKTIKDEFSIGKEL